MRYRNVKTGAEISTSCEISGGDWVEIAEDVVVKGFVSDSDTAPKTRKTARKKAAEE